MMKLRPKSLRRLGIIFTVVALLAAVGIALTIRDRQVRNAHLRAQREAGWSAYINRDYAAAIEPLEFYWRERPNETKIGLAFAESRFRVETSSNQHIKQPIDVLDEILKREPDNLSAKHLLLEIYPQTTNTDALERLSDAVLETNPDDPIALLGRVTVRIRQSRLDDALTTIRRYASLKPQDLQSRIRAMQLMKALQKPVTEIQQFADEQFSQDKMDPRYLLLQAFACNYRNDDAKALWFLQQAAQQPLTDSEFVRTLVSLFDQLKQYEDSQRLLESVAQRTGDPEILRILIARLWQNGHDQEIDQRLSALDATSPKADAELVAMRAMALFQLKKSAQARELLDILAKRTDSSKAAGWATALEARFIDFDQPPVAVATKLANALNRDPENGIFRTWLADSYWELGEAALALRQWQSAAIALPGWSKPYIGMSQALLLLGQAADAHEAAKAAVDRVPNTSSFINLALVRYRLIEESGDLRNARELLKLVEQIQSKVPGESRTLPIYVALLSRTGQSELAIAQIDQVIANGSKYDDETLLRLATVSRDDGLGKEEAILDAAGDRALSSRLALTRATLMSERGRSADGLSFMLKHAGTATPGVSIEWELAVARYREVSNDPAAADAWRQLGNAHDKSLPVQRDILSYARSVRKDRAFVDQTINRLRNLTGEDGQQWRLEKARFLIEGSDIMKDGVEAALLLREIIGNAPRQIEPRLLLARTHELTGNPAGAIDHLRSAQAVDPRSATVALELIRLLQQQGRTHEVRDVLRMLSSNATMNARQRVTLASLMADTGDTRRAIELIEPDEKQNTLVPAGRLLLAELYRRENNTKDAETIYQSLLSAQKPTVSAIASAAEYYATRDDLSTARTVIDQLSRAAAEPVEIAIARARFEERFGTPGAAIEKFREAADTGSEAGYLALIDYYLRQQDFTSAVSIGRTAEAKLPDSASISNRRLEAEALAGLKDDAKSLKPLIEALSHDPSRAAEVDALKAISDIRSGRIPKSEATGRLRAVADKYPRFLPLQEQVIDNYLRENRTDDAVNIARRTMTSLPTEPLAARLAVRTFRAARLWNEMKLAAEQWRTRSSTGTLEADTAIAEALIETGDPAAAATQLARHRALIESDVRTQPQAAVMLARAMIAQGNDNSARKLLEPLLRDASGRRMWMMISIGASKTLQEATLWLQIASAATPNDQLGEQLAIANCWTTLARKYDDQPTLERAVASLTAYLATKPDDQHALMLLGGAQLHLEKFAEAEQSLRAVLNASPDHPSAANDLAYLLVSQSRSLDEAERLARLACDKTPDNAAFRDTLARVLVARKQTDAAKAAFEAALKLDPDLVAARVGYARLLQSTGDSSGATRELRRVDQQLKANPRAGKYLETELASLRADLTGGQ